MNHLASPGAGRGTDSHCYAACEGNRDPALVGRCTPAHTLADPRPLVANSIAIMGAVIGRSSVAGLIADIVWFLIDALLGGLLPPASLSNSIEVLGAQLTHLVMDPNGSITTVNPSGSLTGLLGIVPMLGSTWLCPWQWQPSCFAGAICLESDKDVYRPGSIVVHLAFRYHR